MAQAGEAIKHYHSDNGRFVDSGSVDAINEKYQNIIFCGMGAHHQNDIIDKNNKIQTKGAITLLLHGIGMWPQMLDKIFWPFAIKAVDKRMNGLKIDLKVRMPEYIFHGVEVEDIPVKYYHTLSCPIYKLEARF